MGMKRDSAGVPRGLIRQGDLLLVPVAGLPEGADRVRSGRLVLAEGEATGHAHVVDDERASLHRHPLEARGEVSAVWSATSRSSSSTRSMIGFGWPRACTSCGASASTSPRDGSGG